MVPFRVGVQGRAESWGTLSLLSVRLMSVRCVFSLLTALWRFALCSSAFSFPSKYWEYHSWASWNSFSSPSLSRKWILLLQYPCRESFASANVFVQFTCFDWSVLVLLQLLVVFHWWISALKTSGAEKGRKLQSGMGVIKEVKSFTLYLKWWRRQSIVWRAIQGFHSVSNCSWQLTRTRSACSV